MPFDPTPHLVPAKCGLLVFECQEGVIGEKSPLRGLHADVARRGLVAHLASLLGAARQCGVLVIYCNAAFRMGGPAAPWTPQSDQSVPTGIGSIDPGPVIDELAPHPDDLVIDRVHGMSAFYGTPIEPALRNRGVETLVPTGVSVNIAILATTVEATNRGLRVVVPRDCVAGDPGSYADDVLRYSLRNLAYLSNAGDIAAAWRAQRGSS